MQSRVRFDIVFMKTKYLSLAIELGQSSFGTFSKAAAIRAVFLLAMAMQFVEIFALPSHIKISV